MACGVTNLTEEEVRQDIYKSKTNIRPLENQTQEQSLGYLKSIRNMFTKIEVTVDTLSGKVKKSFVAENGDLVERYAFKSNKELALEGRNTDKIQAKLIKKKGVKAVKEIQENRNNIIKAEVGTKIHQAAQDLMELFIENDSTGLIEKNSTDNSYGLVLKTENEIRSELGVTPAEFERFKKGVREVMDWAVQTQKSIDPKAKVKILTEQVLYNENEDWMGTADLLFVFSDNSFGHIDYKSTVPHKGTYEWDANLSRNVITDSSWFPFYKKDDLNTQMYAINQTLQHKFGLGKMRISRGVPIQTHLKVDMSKPQDERLTSNIKEISMGEDANKYLQPIVTGEMTGIESLDKQLNVLINIKNNMEIKLGQTNYQDPKFAELVADIDRKTRMINKMILSKDISLLEYDVSKILDRYYKKFGQLADIDNPNLEGQINPTYLSTDELTELLKELTAYKQIIDSSGDFMASMGINNPEEFKKYIDRVGALSFRMGGAINTLREKLHERVMNSQEREAIKDAKEPPFWQQWFRTGSEQLHPVIRKFMDFVTKAYDKTRVDTQNKEKAIREQTLALEEWARKNNMSTQDAFNMLINDDTGNLIGKYSKKFFEDMNRAFENDDIKWLTTYLKLRPEAQKRYEQNKKIFIDKGYDKDEVAQWEKNNSIEKLLTHPKKWAIYYQIDQNLPPTHEYYGEKYKEIVKPENKPVLDYFKFYTDTMKESYNLLGLKANEKLPPNFLPWIRADLVEQLFNDGLDFGNVIEAMDAIFKLKEDDTIFGDMVNQDKKVNPVTGEIIPDIPKFFTNPIKDNKGNIAIGLKSRDISKSLYIFYNMAANYNYLKHDVEPRVEALKDVMVSYGVKSQGKDGQDIKDKSGLISRTFGMKLSSLKLFERMINYHLYGIKLQDKNLNNAKVWLALKDIQTKKELAFAPLTWVGNWAQVRTNAFFTGINNYHYNNKQLRNAAKMRWTKDTLYRGLVQFLEPSPGRKNINAKNLSARASLKVINWDTAFWGFRAAEESVNDDILIAMMQNYGYDTAGNIRRLKNLPEGTKSLFEQSSIINGKLVIEGIVDKDGNVNFDNYTALRRMVQGVAKDIKGQPDAQDPYMATTTLFGTMAMSFKGWLPGMTDARLGALRYDHNRQTIVEGKYRAFFKDMNDTEKSVFGFITTEVVSKLAKFVALLPITTFSNKYGYKINETRARTHFMAYKNANKNDADIQNMFFEDFLDYRQGQIKSLAAELFTILSIMSMLMMMRHDWDDDGEPDFLETAIGRTLFRVTNRARREIAFMVNPDDWASTLFRSPVAVTGLAQDALRWYRNTMDEVGDVVYGEDTKREGILQKAAFGRNYGKDKKPVGYETIRWTPLSKSLRMFEIFDEHEQAEF